MNIADRVISIGGYTFFLAINCILAIACYVLLTKGVNLLKGLLKNDGRNKCNNTGHKFNPPILPNDTIHGIHGTHSKLQNMEDWEGRIILWGRHLDCQNMTQKQSKRCDTQRDNGLKNIRVFSSHCPKSTTRETQLTNDCHKVNKSR